MIPRGHDLRPESLSGDPAGTPFDPQQGRLIVVPGLECRPVPDAQRYVLRCQPEHAEVLGRTTGWPLKVSLLSAHSEGNRSALHLGPDEWLLLDFHNAVGHGELQFAAAAAGMTYSLVDAGHRQCAIHVHGPAAIDLLAAGCPLDLDESAFPVDHCTRTLLGKIEIVLWRREPASFRLEFWRSYTDYAWSFLATAARHL